MLVLSRKKNESLVINDDVTIVIVEIRGDKVRIGVEAPKEVPVHRNEVYEALRRNREAREAEFELPSNLWNGSGRAAAVADAARSSAPAGATCLEDPPRAQSAPAEAPAARDGLCCPGCQSDDVRIARTKPAYKGKELVRWRKCQACGNEFHTIERVEQL